MKTYLIITLVFVLFSCKSLAQITNKNMPGLQQSIDSSKVYYQKYFYFLKKMNNSHGRQSARYEDSSVHYYKLLYKK